MNPELTGWHFDGDNLEYGPSNYSFKTNEGNNCKHAYYSFSFEYSFKFLEDEILCAYTVPYLYSDLMSYLKELKTLAKDSCKDP